MADWRFLLDENVDPKIVTYLDTENVDAVHVGDALELSAPDSEVLEYADANDRIVVTSDVGDYAPVSDDYRVALLHDDTTDAHEVAAAIDSLVEAFPSRAEFESLALDDWL